MDGLSQHHEFVYEFLIDSKNQKCDRIDYQEIAGLNFGHSLISFPSA